MSDIVIVALITSVSPILTLIVAAFIKKWFTAVKVNVEAVVTKLEEVHHKIDGLLEEKTLADKAIGNKEGRAELKDESKKIIPK